MRTMTRYIHLLNCAALAAAFACCTGALAGSTLAKPGTAAVPKSVFADDPAKGKDPFFPDSIRRKEALPPVTSPTNAMPESATLFSHLQLKGISGSRDRRLAIINTATLAVGETADIRCAGRAVKVRCREIRESSVVVEIVGLGETREIRLRHNI